MLVVSVQGGCFIELVEYEKFRKIFLFLSTNNTNYSN